MTPIYFVREQYTLTYRNTLDREVRDLVKTHLDHAIMSRAQLEEKYKAICQMISRMNAAHTKVKNKIKPKPLKFHNRGASIIVHDGLHYAAYLVENNHLRFLSDKEKEEITTTFPF